jgi:hypothetical protein
MTKIRQNPAKGRAQIQDVSLEAKLEAIRLALLQRPMARRGAFLITDEDLLGSRTALRVTRVAAFR